MFERIIDEILSGLTGKKESDQEYLVSQIRKYRKHPDFEAIKNVCMRLLGAEEKILRLQITDHVCTPYNILEEADFQMFSGHIKKAGEIYESLIRYAEKEMEKEQSEDMLLLDFREIFEEKLYIKRYKPKKRIQKSTLPYAEICIAYGHYLEEIEEYGKAAEWMLRALKWNPVCCDHMICYAETFWLMNDLPSFRHITMEAFQYAFRPEQIFDCYRNLGRYEAAKGHYKAAYGCYITGSLYFMPDEKTNMEFIALQQNDETNTGLPSAEELEKIKNSLGMPRIPNRDIVEICVSHIKYHYKKNELLRVHYYMEILSDVTGDRETKRALDTLDKMLFG